MQKAERITLARKRLTSILAAHGVATARTLEQKISDAGPNNQRIDPHVLTVVRNAMIEEGEIVRAPQGGVPWFHLGNASPGMTAARLAELLPIYKAFNHGNVSKRVGQTLEIAVYRALLDTDAEFYGRIKDLDQHGDDTLYPKEEPPQHVGKLSLPGDQRLDFLIRHPSAGMLAVECKNVREWLYPEQRELVEPLGKALLLNAVPVIIARRIPFVTFKLFNACGVIFHQTYNQVVPDSVAELAQRVKHKDLLGYHDLRIGNHPDARLVKFIGTNLPGVADDARARFDANRDLLEAFALGDMTYQEFAGRLRRRLAGQNEDGDDEDNGDDDYEYWEE